MRTRLIPLVAGSFLTVAGVVVGTAVAASADPPALNRPTCATTLAQVHDWPGTIPTADGLVVHFSDAYYSYLANRPECSPQTTRG